MKAAKIIVSRDVPTEDILFLQEEGALDPQTYGEPIDWRILSVDDQDFKTRREANKIVNEYAVTILPFILLYEDARDEEPYAALYSEEGPITIERIQKTI